MNGKAANPDSESLLVLTRMITFPLGDPPCLWHDPYCAWLEKRQGHVGPGHTSLRCDTHCHNQSTLLGTRAAEGGNVLVETAR